MQWQLVEPAKIPKLAKMMEGWRAVVVDTETSGLDAYGPDTKLLGIGVGPLDEDIQLYLPVEHGDVQLNELDLAPIMRVLERLPLIGHNIKFDLHHLWRKGWRGRQTRFFDTLVKARLWRREEHPQLGLDWLAGQALGYQYKSPLKKQRKNIWTFSPKAVGYYCCEDVHVDRALYHFLSDELPDHLLRLFAREARLTRDLFDMEQRGFMVDQDFLAQAQEDLDKRIEELLGELRAHAHVPDFNPGSSAQVRKLMNRLGIDPVAVSPKTQEPSWNREALLQVWDQHEAVLPLARYRALKYQRDGMIARCIHACNKWDGIMHFDFRNWGTVTGRLSGDSQQMPKGWLQFGAEPEAGSEDILVWAEDELAKEREFSIRRLLRPRPNHVLVKADYKQIEMYVLGYYINDETFTRWLESGDVHAAAAIDVWGVDEQHPQWQLYRRRGKVYNFATVYGQGDVARAKELDCTVPEAAQYREDYMEHMPGYGRFARRVMRALRDKGYVRNRFDRDYWIDPDVAYRGVNYLVQGSSGDFVKFRLPATRKMRQQAGIHTLNTTHDDFAFEVELGDHGLEALPDFLHELGVSPFKRHLELDTDWSMESLVDLEPYKEGMTLGAS